MKGKKGFVTRCPGCGRYNVPATGKYGTSEGKEFVDVVFACRCGDEYRIAVKGQSAAKLMVALRT